jgi:glycolate oxidase iron-sulfur subunit
MQTKLPDSFKATPEGEEAERILRKCVHCGFCLATCPTYQLLGDELDSPRGRIYLMKQMFEGAPVTERTQLHLDRCLTCRSCESTCPSGVEYGRLVDIGRELVDKAVPRSGAAALKRSALKAGLSNRTLFEGAMALGHAVRPLLPAGVKAKLPEKRPIGDWPTAHHARKMIVLNGCVQPAMAPSIDSAMARVLDKLGISLLHPTRDGTAGGCCGAVPHHLSDVHAGHDMAKANIDAWWPHIERGAEAILVTASGCGAMVAEYGHLLRNDLQYKDRAAKVASLFKDPSQVLTAEAERLEQLLSLKSPSSDKERIAFHPPCSLQHGLKIKGVVEKLLTRAGFALTPVANSHLCCGSAGTYSILQPELSSQLLSNKVNAIAAGKPNRIASANIGCLAHIESGLASHPDTKGRAIVHWVELIDERLRSGDKRP